MSRSKLHFNNSIWILEGKGERTNFKQPSRKMGFLLFHPWFGPIWSFQHGKNSRTPGRSRCWRTRGWVDGEHQPLRKLSKARLEVFFFEARERCFLQGGDGSTAARFQSPCEGVGGGFIFNIYRINASTQFIKNGKSCQNDSFLHWLMNSQATEWPICR